MKKTVSKSSQKKRYQSPKLVRHGSVQKLTKGSLTGVLDDGMVCA